MPRSYYAMAQDGVLPRAFLRVNPHTQVQEVGLAVFGVTMLLPAFALGSFDKLVDYVIFTDTLTIAVVASTLLVLRRQHGAPASLRMAGPGPVLPVLYIGCLLAVCLSVVVKEPRLALVGLVLLLTGWPLFKLGHRLFAR
jgi:APA family basic amino acid/polyamine antiporter